METLHHVLKLAATNEYVVFATPSAGFAAAMDLMGLVERVADDHSGRFRLQITQKGLEVYRAALAADKEESR